MQQPLQEPWSHHVQRQGLGCTLNSRATSTGQLKEQHVHLCQVTRGLSCCSSKQNIFLWSTGSSSLGFWGKVCDRGALIRSQMKQGKFVEVLRTSFINCHTPLSAESLLIPKVWAAKQKSQEPRRFSLKSCFQLLTACIPQMKWAAVWLSVDKGLTFAPYPKSSQSSDIALHRAGSCRSSSLESTVKGEG